MSSVYINHAKSISAKSSLTPQSLPIPGREQEMKQNNAGGFTFTLDQWGILDRFLSIGSESAGYYVGQKETTAKSFATVKACIAADGVRVVNRALEYSLAGRAPKNDPAVVVIALAAVYGDDVTKQAAYDALPRIARTGTWLFMFVSILDSLGKWNAAAKRGVAKWYTSKDMDKLALQLLKYQSRNGWSHRDVLRLAHVKPSSDVQGNLFRYAVGKELELGAAVPQLLVDFEYLKKAEDAKTVLRLVEGNDALTWEMVPSQFLKDKDVLAALVKNMGLTATIRKLGALTAHGVIAPLSAGSKDVIAKLSDVEALRKQRVHPITLLQAFKQYQAGHGEKGSLTWNADQRVLDAINDAFYASFATQEKTSDSYLMGVDCSGSMFGAHVNGSPNLTAAEVAGVMALAVVKNQPNYWIGGFNTKMGELKITPSMRLDAVLQVMQRFSWGGTDCALPMLHAAQHGMEVDKFVTITDSETWAGSIQPTQALRDYRQKFGRAARNVVIGTSMTEFTIADPLDPYQLDVAGFDSAAPQLIAQL
jgi:60 kDa SS-A/Ro ribonucleoprotein